MSDKKDASSGGSDQGSKGPAEKTDTGKSVSELLAEWEENRSGSDDGKKTDAGKDELAKLRAKVAELESAHVADRDDKDYSDLMSKISGDLEVDESIVDGWLRKRAKNDPAIIKAFDNRSDKPAQYKELVKALQPEFAEWAKENIATKNSGLKAAVRSARETDPDSGDEFENVNWGSLSDSDFTKMGQRLMASYRKKGS